ncbi:hypothetical protein Dimus_013224, partial [Dionaea muscipula]
MFAAAASNHGGERLMWIDQLPSLVNGELASSLYDDEITASASWSSSEPCSAATDEQTLKKLGSGLYYFECLVEWFIGRWCFMVKNKSH